jgi:hypothetical protein
MKLETPLLDEFCRFVRSVPGCEMLATFRAPDGGQRQFDLVALLGEVHGALHATHHFIDPTGPRNDAFRPEPVYVKPEDNPTSFAALGHPETP